VFHQPVHIQQRIGVQPSKSHEPRSQRAGAAGSWRHRLCRQLARWWAIGCVGLALLIAFPGGCTRPHYRKQADQESLGGINERTHDPRWDLKLTGIYPNARSRFADPYDPDHPPMPPDDPSAHEYMNCADGKRGSKHWHDDGDLNNIESLEWKNYLSLDENGYLVLDEEKAIEIGLIHSRQYQQQIETLYLSALDLTFQRFRFDTWYFAGNNTNFRHFGTGGFDGGERNTLTTRTAASASGAGGQSTGAGASAGRLFPTGATMLVDFANSFVWQFSGGNTHNVTSGFNMTLVQPLLRNAGRKVVLESLTRSERSVLYAVRDFERYRQDFYVDITTGAGKNVGVQREAGLAAGLGTELSFGSAGGSQVFGAGGGGAAGVTTGATGGATGGTGAGQVEGVLGLVQRQINIRNLEYNVAATADSLIQLDALQEAGRVDIIQVDQARQRLQTARSNLLQSKAAYEADLDRFKQQLGLPPNMKIRIDGSKFVFLELIDREVVELQNQAESLLNQVRELPDPPSVADVTGLADQGRKLADRARGAFAKADKDFDKLQASLPQRVQTIRVETDKAAFLEEMQKLTENFRGLKDRFSASSRPLEAPPEGDAKERRKQLQQRLTEVSGQLLELSLAQTRARLEVVTLPSIDATEEEGIRIARENELGLMNARGQLVDTWRGIEFRANQLKSDLNLTFNADVQTPPIGTNPGDFRAENSTYTMGVRFDAPLTKVSERNQYREQLIRYQQARRNYMLADDRIVASVRGELRSDTLNRSNFELRRSGLVIALRQVDQTREKLTEPPRPNQAAGSTTARDLLDALVNLLNNQNDFISVWFNSEAVRRSFYRDIGLMRIGDDGTWIDAYRNPKDLKPEELNQGLEATPAEPSGKPTILRGMGTRPQAPRPPATELVDPDDRSGFTGLPASADIRVCHQLELVDAE